MLVLGAEPHHVLDARPVVPAAVEDDDFAGGGEVGEVSLEVDLALLAIRRRRQRHDAEDARADPLGEGPDRSPFPGAVPAFDHDDHAQAFFLHPGLQMAQTHLELLELLFILTPLHRMLIRGRIGITRAAAGLAGGGRYRRDPYGVGHDHSGPAVPRHSGRAEAPRYSGGCVRHILSG